METPKDRPSTWISYRQALCANCLASCCMMPVEVRAEDLVRLKLVTPDEIQRSKKRVFKKLKRERWVSSYREGSELFMLQAKTNGECPFLDSHTRRCSRYEDRPQVCRDFPLRAGPRIGCCPYEPRRLSSAISQRNRYIPSRRASS
ncbi:MAG: zinc/iron-chelating domain-containing protein [Bdellovibrio sp.]|nr:MAG: zinc/iron-chelating domain-containing protein [Bdellovibrio sp.]